MGSEHDHEQLRRYFDGESSKEERAVVEAHLAGCKECTESLAFMRFFKVGLQEDLSLNPVPCGQCPPVRQMLDFIDRRLPRVELRRIRIHVALCPQCSENVRDMKRIRAPRSTVSFTFKWRPDHLWAFVRRPFEEVFQWGYGGGTKIRISDLAVTYLDSEEAEDHVGDVKSELPSNSTLVTHVAVGDQTVEIGCRLEHDRRLILGLQPAPGGSLSKARLELLSAARRKVHATTIEVREDRGFGIIVPERMSRRTATIRLKIGAAQADVSIAGIEPAPAGGE